ncbi:amidohydrolase family protein [Dactylosporangium sp. CA-092794]|uniref:amidohydrolase family protein n=1 Tax=Dactylosporangium sp. CA-092794 TaxID=3239929 RepID=UPI003D8BAE55
MSAPTFTVLDAHVHMWLPEYIPATLRMSWAKTSVLRKGMPLDAAADVYPRVSSDIVDPDGAHLLTALDRAGIGRAIIMGVDYGPEAWAATEATATAFMERLDRVCRDSDGRLAFNAGIDPRRPEAVAHARTYLRSDACRGLKFYPPAGIRADEKHCFPLYEALIDADKTAVFHCGIGRGSLRWGNAWPIHLVGVQARYPELKIVLAHSGYMAWFDECVALAAAHPRTYLELSLWEKEALADGSPFRPMLERAVRLAGGDRILFGSDTMFGESLRGVEQLAAWRDWFLDLPKATSNRIPAATVEDMLRRNAEEVYFGNRSPRTPSTIGANLDGAAR